MQNILNTKQKNAYSEKPKHYDHLFNNMLAHKTAANHLGMDATSPW